MISTRSTKSHSGLAAALMVVHLAAFLCAPWFHQHAGYDHSAVKGDLHHSHISTSTSRPPEFRQDRQDLPEVLHLLEGSPLFDKMHVSIDSHSGQISISGKYVPQIDFFGLIPASISLPAFVAKTILNRPDAQPTQNYFVLIAAGLSPPALA